jgi:hypothetical protein
MGEKMPGSFGLKWFAAIKSSACFVSVSFS